MKKGKKNSINGRLLDPRKEKITNSNTNSSLIESLSYCMQLEKSPNNEMKGHAKEPL